VIAWLFRAFLALECLLWWALAGHWLDTGVAGGEVALRIALLAGAWRFSHGAITWVAAQALRLRDRRSLDWQCQFAALGRELAARLVSFNWSQPFPALSLRGEPVGTRSGTPILLVHGFFSNRGIWHGLRKRLAAKSLGPVYAMELAPVFGAVPSMAASLHRRIEAIRAATGAPHVDLIAHSMGGLVARQYFRESGTAAVRRFVSLGSPHHGTEIARLALFPCVRDMQRNAVFLAELAAHEMAHPPQLETALSIYSNNDDLVYPPESCRLHWARNLALQGIGHVSLCFDGRVADEVMRALT
jgi:triacylglycerol esterase/lipase EstA (alpha/beta hydrolase family)